jgi:hypothetical protein
MNTDYETIDHGNIERLAQEITVGTSGQKRYPYRAIYDVAVPGCIAEGHPYQLSATGTTPQEAVGELVGMLTAWYEDPTSPQLEAPEGDLHGERRAHGLKRRRPIVATIPTAPTRRVA